MDDPIVDIHQARQIGGLSAQVATTADRVSGLRDDVARLSLRLERTLLLNAAMWDVLKRTLAVDDADLKSTMLEIDARDGKVDGRFAAPVVPCRACGRALQNGRSVCIFCEADHLTTDPFHAL